MLRDWRCGSFLGFKVLFDSSGNRLAFHDGYGIGNNALYCRRSRGPGCPCWYMQNFRGRLRRRREITDADWECVLDVFGIAAEEASWLRFAYCLGCAASFDFFAHCSSFGECGAWELARLGPDGLPVTVESCRIFCIFARRRLPIGRRCGNVRRRFRERENRERLWEGL